MPSWEVKEKTFVSMLQNFLIRLQDVATNITSEATSETKENREALTALHAALKYVAIVTSTANHG